MAYRKSITGDPAVIPLALAFETVRQFRQGNLARPREWLDQIIGRASPAAIAQECEAYLQGARPVELSSWVMDEMPSHEARLIDDKSDLLRASIISMAIATEPQQQDLRLVVGSNLVALKERLLAEIDALERNPQQLTADYGIADVAARLKLIKRSFLSAFETFERAARGRLRAAPTNVELAETLVRKHLETTWREGFPRSLLANADLELRGEWRPGIEYLGIRRLELKDFFTIEGIDEQTMSMLGSAWARAFLEGESKRLFERLGRLPRRTWRLRSLRERIDRAIASLGRATHLVGPADWRLWEALEPSEYHTQRGEGGFLGTVGGLAAFQAWEKTDSVFVLSLPSAIRVQQWQFEGRPFSIDVRAVDEALAEELIREDIQLPGDDTDAPAERLQTRVLVDAREAMDIRVSRPAVIRVGIPADLRDDY